MVTMRDYEYVNQLNCGIHIYQNIKLYTLNIYNSYLSVILNKAGEK